MLSLSSIGSERKLDSLHIACGGLVSSSLLDPGTYYNMLRKVPRHCKDKRLDLLVFQRIGVLEYLDLTKVISRKVIAECRELYTKLKALANNF